MHHRRHLLPIPLLAIGLVACSVATGEHAPAAGPLGASWPNLSAGHYLVEGSTLTDNQTWGMPNDSGSEIVLQGVSLKDASPGLTLIGAVAITDTPLEMEPHAPGFPSPTGLPSVPVEGLRVPPEGRINLALGLRIDDVSAVNGFEGVLIDYTVQGTAYRATLAYRSVLCPAPYVEGRTCDSTRPGPPG